DALHRRGAARSQSPCLRAVRRRRAYVHRSALRQHAGEDLRTALPAKSGGVARARLPTGMADVADPQAPRRAAGNGESGVKLKLSLPGLTRQSIALRGKLFFDGCAGPGYAK